jgi:hypothetical protein
MDSGVDRRATVAEAESVASQQPRKGLGLQEKVLGGFAVLLIAAAIFLLVRNGLSGEDVAPVPTAPAVAIVSPASGTVVGRNIELRFTSDEALSVQPGGWGAGGLHIHADVGGQEVMPSSTDIRPLQDGSYGWTLQAPDTGSIALRLFWSDEVHVPVPLSASEDVFLTIR